MFLMFLFTITLKCFFTVEHLQIYIFYFQYRIYKVYNITFKKYVIIVIIDLR